MPTSETGVESTKVRQVYSPPFGDLALRAKSTSVIHTANRLLLKYPGRPILALWEALRDSTLASPDVAMAIVNDVRCGLEYTEEVQGGRRGFLGYLIPNTQKVLVTPLILASCTSHVNVMDALLAAGADLNNGDAAFTALHAAVAVGDAMAIDLLISKGADASVITEYDELTLHEAASKGDSAAIIILIAKGANVNASDKYTITPLHWAAVHGHMVAMEMLISKGADVMTVVDGDTSLHYAVLGGNVQAIEMLSTLGVDVNAVGNEGYTPLHSAVDDGRVHSIEVLVSLGADLNAVDTNGNTPLHLAARLENDVAMKTLLDIGADIIAVNSNGSTPLQLAIQDSKYSVIDLLMANGAGEKAGVNESRH